MLSAYHFHPLEIFNPFIRFVFANRSMSYLRIYLDNVLFYILWPYYSCKSRPICIIIQTMARLWLQANNLKKVLLALEYCQML